MDPSPIDFLIIDGCSLGHAVYFAGGQGLTTSDGKPTGLLAGFYRSAQKMVNKLQPKRVFIALEGGALERNKIYPLYKDGREKKHDDLRKQINSLAKFCQPMGWTSLREEGMEADDIIASFCTESKKRGLSVAIHTSDKDMYALIGPGIGVYRRFGSDYNFVKTTDIVDKFGVEPHQIPDYLAIAGDSSDNIPGVYGLGEKTTAKLLAKYGTADAIYENIADHTPNLRAKLEAGRKGFEISRVLVKMREDIAFPEETFSPVPIPSNHERMMEIFTTLEMHGARQTYERAHGLTPTRPLPGRKNYPPAAAPSEPEIAPASNGSHQAAATAPAPAAPPPSLPIPPPVLVAAGSPQLNLFDF